MASLPDSPMATHPSRVAEQRFEGELDEDFDAALCRVKNSNQHRSLSRALARIFRRLGPWKERGADDDGDTVRKVAFDGFRSTLYDDKLERDRRYGTVYTVSEAVNAYLVRLELPRRTPNSALKRLWNLPDEMPDYDYSIALSDGVLSIHGAVPGEALRRLSYVSPSFPSEFLTRIEFGNPVGSFRHRLRDRNLDIIVFKRENDSVKTAA